MRLFQLIQLAVFCFFATSCSDQNSVAKRGGPIVFGDSSMIVTETDPQFLTNNVLDFVPSKIVPIEEQPAVEVSQEANKQQEPRVAEDPSKGLEVPFKSLEIFVNDIDARLGSNVDWAKDRGAAYTLTDGNLNHKSLSIKGKVTDMVMRYETVLMITLEGGQLQQLDKMPSYTSDWQDVKGSKGVYPIVGLGKQQIKFGASFSSKTLSRAVQALARSNKMSRSEERDLLRSIRKVRAYNQAPFSIALSTVIWKITAKDASGKSFQRELRFDIHP